MTLYGEERTASLGAGDAAKLTGAGSRMLTAEETAGAEILIWETDGTI